MDIRSTVQCFSFSINILRRADFSISVSISLWLSIFLGIDSIRRRKYTMIFVSREKRKKNKIAFQSIF